MGSAYRALIVGLCAWGILSVTGCGYRFMVEGPGPVIGHVRDSHPDGRPLRVAVLTFENRTFEPDLELKYTEYLKKELEASGAAEIVQDEQDAEWILTGAIESVSLPSLTFTPNQTRESRVTVSVKVQVRDRRTGTIRWTQTVQGSAEFFVGAAPEVEGGTAGLQFNRVLQDRALEQAGQLIAEDVTDRFLIARDQGTFVPASPRASSPSDRSHASDNRIALTHAHSMN